MGMGGPVQFVEHQHANSKLYIYNMSIYVRMKGGLKRFAFEQKLKIGI